MSKQSNFVESVSDSKLVVQCASRDRCHDLRNLGGKRKTLNRRIWVFDFASEEELAGLLNNLRDLGFAMAGGSSGWPPAAVFESLREKGKTTGQFQEMLWKAPDEASIIER